MKLAFCSHKGDHDVKSKTRLSTKKIAEVFLGEFFGMFLLMFMGCMACATGIYPSSVASIPQMPPFLFGLVLIAVIQMTGHISGAHVNLAVTLAALLMGQIEMKLLPVYVIAQVLGAFAGFGVLRVVIPTFVWNFHDEGASATGLCTTVPQAELTATQAFILEFIVTSVLVLCLCACWDKRNARDTDSLPVRLGLLLAGSFIIFAPYTGASLNSIRTLVPAIFSNAPHAWKHHWVYWTAPNLAGVVWPILYKFYQLNIVEECLEEDHVGHLGQTRDFSVVEMHPSKEHPVKK